MMAIMLFVILALVFVAIGCRDSGMFDIPRRARMSSSSCGVSAKKSATHKTTETQKEQETRQGSEQSSFKTADFRKRSNYNRNDLDPTMEHPRFAKKKGTPSNIAHILHGMCHNNGKPAMPTIDKSCNGLWFGMSEEHTEFRKTNTGA